MDLGKKLLSITCALLLSSCGGITNSPIDKGNGGTKKPGDETKGSYGKVTQSASQHLTPALLSGISLAELNRVLDLSFNNGATRQDPSCYDLDANHTKDVKSYTFDYRPAKCSLSKYSPKGIETLIIRSNNDLVQTVEFASTNLNFKYHSGGSSQFVSANKIATLNNTINIQRITSNLYRARVQLDIIASPYKQDIKKPEAPAISRWKVDTYIEFDFTNIGKIGMTAQKIVSDVKLDVEGSTSPFWSDTKVEYLQDKQNGIFLVDHCGLPLGSAFYTYESKTTKSLPGVVEFNEKGVFSTTSNVQYEWNQLAKDTCFQGLRPLVFNFIAGNVINE